MYLTTRMERCAGLRKIFVYKEKSIVFYFTIFAKANLIYTNCMEKNKTLLYELNWLLLKTLNNLAPYCVRINEPWDYVCQQD